MKIHLFPITHSIKFESDILNISSFIFLEHFSRWLTEQNFQKGFDCSKMVTEDIPNRNSFTFQFCLDILKDL